MAQHVIEAVTFKLKVGVTRERFVESAARANAFIVAQPGFVRRRLSRAEDGTWTEHVEWDSMAAAEAAAAVIGKSVETGPFLDAIDGSTIALSHSVLEIAVN